VALVRDASGTLNFHIDCHLESMNILLMVPSKILSIMAAGRPVVACMNLDGDAPRLVEGAGCGYVLPPEDPRIPADHILKLYEDKELREEMGRKGREYAERELALTVAAERYVELIKKVRREGVRR